MLGLGVNRLGVNRLGVSTKRISFPSDLFKNSEQGVWYDPSDLSTLYQDAAGTTPVTADGDPVGLMLDKAKGKAYPARLFPDIPIALGDSISTAITAALVENAAISNSGTYYVKPSTGSDSGAGTEADPFATVSHAMRVASGAASRVAMLEDAVIPPFDLRFSDASQSSQQFKWLDANGFDVVIRTPAPDLTSFTWAQDGTYTNCYKAALGLTGSAKVTRLLSSSVDDYGYEAPLRKYASAAALDAGSDSGWYWEDGAKTLWVNVGSDFDAVKSDYRALCTDTNGNSRLFVYGASLGLSGVRMEGVQIFTLDGGSRRPEVWLHDVEQLWSVSKGGDIRGWYVATDCRVYSSEGDGCNAFTAWVGGKSLIQTVRSEFIRSGDRRVFDLNGTLQGVSAHGGSHHISFGSSFIENNGQAVADTCAASSEDFTWLVGCTLAGGAAGVSSALLEVGSSATSASRRAFVDGLAFSGSATDIQISTNGEVQRWGEVADAVSGGSVLPYGEHAKQSTALKRPTWRESGAIKWLEFSGSQSLVIDSLDLSGSDKVSVVCSLQKSSDAAGGVVLEHSESAASNDGCFTVLAPSAGGFDNYGFYSKGTVGTLINQSGHAAPSKNTLSCRGDISGDLSSISVDGVSSENAGDQGSGNYGEHPAYIGARGGASVHFSGDLYALFAVSRGLSGEEELKCIRYASNKAGL